MFNGFNSLLFCLFLTGFLANAEFSRPESAHYYAAEKVFFVSSTNGSEKGWISKLDANGRVIEARWADQLQRPMGMRVFEDRLWVNNKTEVVGLSLDKSASPIVYPIPGAEILNDLAVDKNGYAYLSDSLNSRILKLNLSTGEVSVFYDTRPSAPNGLLVVEDRLFVASWGNLDPRRPGSWATIKNGGMYSLSTSQPDERDWLVRSVGNLDGIEMTSEGDIYFSDWGSGRLHLLKVGETQSTVIGEFGRGLADIGLNSETGELLLPQMLNNRVELVRP